MSLNYHFKVEQESGSTRHAFFGFNGIIQSQNILKITIIEYDRGHKPLHIKVTNHYTYLSTDYIRVGSHQPSH